MKELKNFKVGDRSSRPVGTISFKSPMEHNVKFIYGDPYLYITVDSWSKSEEEYLWELDTETNEYVLLEISKDGMALYEKALKKNDEIRDKLYPNNRLSNFFEP